MSPLISVVIPSYNCEKFIASAVESALDQSLKPAEIIIVDDGSTDQTAESLSRFGSSIRYVWQGNRGPAAARNRGVSEARCDLIAFLDADDIWLSSKLEVQLNELQGNPKAGLVHSAFFWWDDFTGERSQEHVGRDFSGRCYPLLVFRNGVWPSTVLMRRSCFDAIGGFDESIRKASVEDYDLFVRFARYFELAYVDEPLVLYRRHAQNASKQTLAMLQGEVYVVTKALKEDPELRRKLDGAKIRARVHEICSDAAHACHNQGLGQLARHYSVRAGMQRPTDWYVWMLYVANLLPAQWVRQLRKIKGNREINERQ